MEQNCLLKYEGQGFFYGSLAEPMSCIVGAFRANYHTENGSYVHKMGIKPGGKVAILAGVGPMGMGFIDYAINGPVKPSLLVVTDIDEARLDRASKIYTPERAAANGIQLIYKNTSAGDPVAELMELTDGTGYDDVFALAPVRAVVEQADRILGRDGCLDFFAGPTNPEFKAEFNFYNVHYASTHVVGTSGGNTEDMIISLDAMAKGLIDPSVMITHVGGMNATIETTLNLPKIPGGKKLIYNHIDLPLTAIADFEAKGESDPLFAELARICKANNNLWCPEAEKYLLANAKAL
jgi:threonine dehydrogenase-like Zn-dependent dehydrogenase